MLRALLILVINEKMQRTELVEYCTLLLRENLKKLSRIDGAELPVFAQILPQTIC